MSHNNEKNKENPEIAALRQLAENNERELHFLQQNLESIAKKIDNISSNSNVSIVSKKNRDGHLSIRLDRLSRKILILFTFFLILSGISLAFFSAKIGELLSLLSFACIVIAGFGELFHIILERF